MYDRGRRRMMSNTHQEVMQFIKEQDVRFARLVFCDIFGQIKNISISASELERAFSSGISFDASSVKGFLEVEESDLLLFPDPATLSILPWRPARAVWCGSSARSRNPMEPSSRETHAHSCRRQ